MQKKHLFFLTILTINTFLVLSACGNESEPAASTTVVPSSVEAEYTPQTEEEYRAAIAKLSGDESALETVQGYYEKLLAMDVFTEADYAALAEIYAKSGNQALQADMLTKAHKLYPSEEYINALSNLIWTMDSDNAQAADLLSQINTSLETNDLTAVTTITSSDSWNALFGNELAGVTTRTNYKESGKTTRVNTDTFSTEIIVLADNGELSYYKCDTKGFIVLKAVFIDNVYEGAFSLNFYDTAQSQTHGYEGTLRNNYCTGNLQITYAGNVYTGNFDEQGHTTEKQIASVTKDGDVVYAYGKNNSYLYVTDTTSEEFVIDNAFLNLPTITDF